MRYGQWKFYFPHSFRRVSVEGADGKAGKYIFPKTGYALYNVANDASESNNLITDYPEVFEKLSAMGLAFEAELAANRSDPGQYGKKDTE